jgi:23S rRNA (uracil1939-C5)-methyltransferase
VTGNGPALTIARLGAQGDGIAETPDGLRYVPFALPGERVRTGDGALPEIVSGSNAERRPPICQHFGLCGGCAAQHMSDALYSSWKRGILVEAFRQQGMAPKIDDMIRIGPGTRRRVVLTARRAADAIVLGYHRRASHDLIDIAECPVARPGIVARLTALRALAAILDANELRLTVLESREGLDVAINGAGITIGARAAASVAAIAAQHGFTRVSLNGQTVVEKARPTLGLGNARLLPTPAGFVQAVAEAEHAMVSEVLRAIKGARRIADLFAGIGTFALPMARQARVLAIDGDQTALSALSEAARGAAGLKPIETKQRDLYRQPLSPRELADVDAVVLDPPRAGARSQVERIAQASVPIVAYVSCNPATLARDARLLVNADYRVEGVFPIDQFLYSAHLEAVAVLRRNPVDRGRTVRRMRA